MKKLCRTFPTSLYQLRIAFSFALEAMMHDSRVGWDVKDFQLAKDLRRGTAKLPGYTRMWGDRFAFFCQEMRLSPLQRNLLWNTCFEVPYRDYQGYWKRRTA